MKFYVPLRQLESFKVSWSSAFFHVSFKHQGTITTFLDSGYGDSV